MLLLITILISSFACENPLKEEKTKPLVIEILDNEPLDPGRYVVYWDGKNKDKEYIDPGTYIILLEIRGDQDQDFVNAVPGGKPGENNKYDTFVHYQVGYYPFDHLEAPDPDPFQVFSGVTLPFVLHNGGNVSLSIFKDTPEN